MQAIEDAVAYVKERPERFCRAGGPEPVEVATNLVSEALILGAREACVVRYGEWWVISSDEDWLQTHPQYVPKELFFRLVAFPEAGPNSIRTEVLVTAFAQQVITIGEDGHFVVKGHVAPTDTIWQWLKSPGGWKRVVAFQMAPD